MFDIIQQKVILNQIEINQQTFIHSSKLYKSLSIDAGIT